MAVKKSLLSHAKTAFFATAALVIATAGRAEAPLVVIFDGSASMHEPWQSHSKIDVARQALADFAARQPPERPMALVAFGSQKKGECLDFATLQPMQTGAGAAIAGQISRLIPKGKSPVADSLALASGQLAGRPGHVLLVTDSPETCGRDLCAAARALPPGSRLDILALRMSDTSELICAAQATGGSFRNLSHEAELRQALLSPPPSPAKPSAASLQPQNGLWHFTASPLQQQGECAAMIRPLVTGLLATWATPRAITWPPGFDATALQPRGSSAPLVWSAEGAQIRHAARREADFLLVSYRAELLRPDHITLRLDIRAEGNHAFLRLKNCRYSSQIDARWQN